MYSSRRYVTVLIVDCTVTVLILLYLICTRAYVTVHQPMVYVHVPAHLMRRTKDVRNAWSKDNVPQ